MLNIKKMLVLIAARPQIRTVEIADIIDCDTEQVQPFLQSHIDRGDLTLTEVTAPNGRPANAFMITRQFMGTSAYETMLPSIAAQRAADEAIKPTPIRAPAPVAAPRPSEQSMIAPGEQRIAVAAPTNVVKFSEIKTMLEPHQKPSKVELALAFLEGNGSASSADLRDAMGLSKFEYPSNFLKAAMFDGRIRKFGANYFPRGADVRLAIVPAKRAAPTQKIEPVSVSVPAMPAPLVAEQEPARFRWASWSDGSIEIERDGKSVLTLTPGECAQLATVMVRTKMAVAEVGQ